MACIKSLINDRRDNVFALEFLENEIIEASKLIADTLRSGNTLFICGNGGSAADAQHMAAEFTGKFKRERKGLRAIALTTDTSSLTAVANDWDYTYVFRRQLEALARDGDIVIGISTSGESKSILRALEIKEILNVKTIGLVGTGDFKQIKQPLDVIIRVGGSTPIAQERHLMVEHIICELVEEYLHDILF